MYFGKGPFYIEPKYESRSEIICESLIYKKKH